MAKSDPKPVKPRVKDAKSYERAVRDVYLNPFIARIQARLATVISVQQHLANSPGRARRAGGVPRAPGCRWPCSRESSTA